MLDHWFVCCMDIKYIFVAYVKLDLLKTGVRFPRVCILIIVLLHGAR